MLSTPALLFALSLPLPQDEGAPAPALTFSSEGIDAMLVDRRDAGVLRALSMLDDRILEVAGDEIPEPVARLVVDLLSGPFDLEVRPAVEHMGAGLPVHVQLRVRGDAERLGAFGQRFEGLLAAMMGEPQPVAGSAERKSVALPFGLLQLGAGEGGYVISLDDPRPFHATPRGLPAEVPGAWSVSFDAKGLQPFLEMFMQGELAELEEILEFSGLLGEEPLAFQVSVGPGGDRYHGTMRTGNWVPLARANGALVTEPLKLSELRLVPADATMALVGKVEPTSIARQLELYQDELPLDLDTLNQDLLEPLGTTVGYYTSRATGGGGILSLVAFASVEDEATLRASIEKYAAQVGDATSQLGVEVGLREWSAGGHLCWSLSFPGLPIPFEPAFSFADGFLLVGATPQALVAALSQRALARGDGHGLVDEPRFRQMMAGSLDDLNSVTFMDVPELLEDGYWAALLASSALANAVRSEDPPREAGLVVPPFPELAAGALPSVTVGRIVGDDLVQTMQMDRSVVVQMTGVMGTPIWGFVAAGIAAGAAIPAAMANSMEAQGWEEMETTDPHAGPHTGTGTEHHGGGMDHHGDGSEDSAGGDGDG